MSRSPVRLAIALASAVVTLSCSVDGETYTPYRNSVTDDRTRIHVATFDADQSAAYNQENCAQAQELFQQQSDVKVKFWCEKGQYEK